MLAFFAEVQRAAATAAIERFVQFVGTVAGSISPQAWDNVDEDEMIDEYAERINLPPKIIRALKEVLAIRAQRGASAAGASAAPDRHGRCTRCCEPLEGGRRRGAKRPPGDPRNRWPRCPTTAGRVMVSLGRIQKLVARQKQAGEGRCRDRPGGSSSPSCKRAERRRYVYRSLTSAGIWFEDLNLEPQYMAMKAGLRNEGLRLLALIHEHCPENYIRMWQESNRAAREDKVAAVEALEENEDA